MNLDAGPDYSCMTTRGLRFASAARPPPKRGRDSREEVCAPCSAPLTPSSASVPDHALEGAATQRQWQHAAPPPRKEVLDHEGAEFARTLAPEAAPRQRTKRALSATSCSATPPSVTQAPQRRWERLVGWAAHHRRTRGAAVLTVKVLPSTRPRLLIPSMQPPQIIKLTRCNQVASVRISVAILGPPNRSTPTRYAPSLCSHRPRSSAVPTRARIRHPASPRGVVPRCTPRITAALERTRLRSRRTPAPEAARGVPPGRGVPADDGSAGTPPRGGLRF